MYCQQWGIDYLILRFFNVYGDRQNTQYAGVITAFNLAFQNKQPLIIYGDGEQTRDFVSVNDVCNYISKLIITTIKNDIFNIGTGKSISINNLAKQFSDNIIHKEAKKEVSYSCADVKKLFSILNV
jgi:UDP-glucose 4-epimerase